MFILDACILASFNLASVVNSKLPAMPKSSFTTCCHFGQLSLASPSSFDSLSGSALDDTRLNGNCVSEDSESSLVDTEDLRNALVPPLFAGLANAWELCILLNGLLSCWFVLDPLVVGDDGGEVVVLRFLHLSPNRFFCGLSPLQLPGLLSRIFVGDLLPLFTCSCRGSYNSILQYSS